MRNIDLICTIIVQTLSYRTKQFLFTLIKLSIVFAALYFIYQKLINNNTLDFSDFYKILTENTNFSINIISFLLFLSAFNWFLEILKWQSLVSSFKKISFKNATAQSLGSLTASLITPNRIGEYGAKAMYYQARFRKKIVAINLISNLLQLFTTTVLGLIGFVFFLQRFETPFSLYTFSIYGSGLLGLVLLLSFTIFKGKFKFKAFSTEKVKRFLTTFPKDKLLQGLGLSFLRYAVFSFQFYFLLQVFQIQLTYLESLIIISTMYLLASVIPSIFIFDVLVKGSISVFLFSFAHVNELIVLSVVTLMWLLNFVLPSLMGSYYVLKFDFKNNIA
ncbi:lysylphosphatidylglycerol synthase domain-containing protein [Tamlana sp. 2_MG-2023]|uniref:lysylphosphatidylglycerol synthase domain-containing protein n=1 Tax=unclassified Tamlana TaxID=2614803 RepID=UPI0026E3A455|nr:MULTISPECIES: lysylphosphatidylglycerol synthase domain-containing protein [unclassified Tamlana]MDO6761777.1 lysylphosphatidylglycerol synthase domain-containing protein [Tamlana sp. 2_MG-2023]MDO6792538.1 lysylphosphatidylglycerol synthase domain-containing protein [Tamlana sp. 1_MG-2023]